MRWYRFASAVCLLLMFAGCSMFATAPQTIRSGDDVVVILNDGSSFKDAVVERITSALGEQGYTVVTDHPRRAKFYHAADFGAVIHMAEYWAWHVPWHQKQYYNENDQAANIIFVVTSGDPDVTIDKPFDAVTSASEQDRIAPVSDEIMRRLDTILQ